ncbi:MAG: hypothetical protein CMJ59_07690 [Planctomycetaceae bacterium]|nr:hypothetical protein [Planctomycetaceae bacterium]
MAGRSRNGGDGGESTGLGRREIPRSVVDPLVITPLVITVPRDALATAFLVLDCMPVRPAPRFARIA